MSKVRTLEHPLASSWVSELRSTSTGAARFRRLVGGLAGALAWEALAAEAVEPYPVRTPLTTTTGVRLADPCPIVVPVLRAGVWMVEAVLALVPDASVAMVGLARDEATLVATAYLDKLPPSVDGRRVLLLDPMLATGGSLVEVGERLLRHGAPRAVSVLALLAAPEGIGRVTARFPTWDLVVAAVDDHLDGRGFIVPGLGDAGDRLSG